MDWAAREEVLLSKKPYALKEELRKVTNSP